MPKKLSDDLLWRVIYLNHTGKSPEQIASLLFISKSIIVKTLANYTKRNHVRNSSINQQGRRKLFNYSEMKVRYFFIVFFKYFNLNNFIFRL